VIVVMIVLPFVANGSLKAATPGPPSSHVVGTQDGDELRGTARADRVEGLGGDDYIYGLGGDDSLVGGSGHDEIDGGSGDDLLLGGPGNDLLRGGSGSDSARGGKGRDFLNIRSAEGDVASCGPGLDTVRADRLDRVGSDCERRSFADITPRVADGRHTRTIRFVSQNRGDADGQVIELRGPRGSGCERLADLQSFRGPLEGLHIGDIERLRFGVRLQDDPAQRRYHPRTRRGPLTTLCRGVYRGELKLDYCGGGDGCDRTVALERFFFRVV
jgi:Ca2+-binding RTX toxin-like protein